MSEVLRGSIQPDGSLANSGWYLHWKPGDAEATLDGTFTAEELRAIADYMERVTREHNGP